MNNDGFDNLYLIYIPDEVRGLMSTLKQAHEDNRRSKYFAEYDNDKDNRYSIMPVTTFIFEFFIFNSIYNINWLGLNGNNEVLIHNNQKEKEQIKEFLKFLKVLYQDNPSLVIEQFMPLTNYVFKGDWTEIESDKNITSEAGRKFFATMNSFRILIKNRNIDLQQNIEKINSYLFEGCDFIYSVRCNIFHGSKRLAETYDPDQKKRIELYQVFLSCLNELVFKCVLKHQQGTEQFDSEP